MSDPLGLVSLALGAGSGRFDELSANQLVAAGLTIRQRSAPLVRALARRRTAAIMPACPAFLTALAASEGHGMVWMDPLQLTWEELRDECVSHNVGALFTLSQYLHTWPAEARSMWPIILLDQVPAKAVASLNNKEVVLDLGSHFGLSLEGTHDAAGSEEECLIVKGKAYTHRQLLNQAREHTNSGTLALGGRSTIADPAVAIDPLVTLVIAPLLEGGGVYSAGTAPEAVHEAESAQPPKANHLGCCGTPTPS